LSDRDVGAGPDIEQGEEILDDGARDEPDADAVQVEVLSDGVEAMQWLGDDDLEVALAREVGGELLSTVERARDPQVQSRSLGPRQMQGDDEVSGGRPEAGVEHAQPRRRLVARWDADLGGAS
jgi:hypothetical protein